MAPKIDNLILSRKRKKTAKKRAQLAPLAPLAEVSRTMLRLLYLAARNEARGHDGHVSDRLVVRKEADLLRRITADVDAQYLLINQEFAMKHIWGLLVDPVSRLIADAQDTAKWALARQRIFTLVKHEVTERTRNGPNPKHLTQVMNKLDPALVKEHRGAVETATWILADISGMSQSALYNYRTDGGDLLDESTGVDAHPERAILRYVLGSMKIAPECQRRALKVVFPSDHALVRPKRKRRQPVGL